MSHPMRVRGLKHKGLLFLSIHNVAPHAGAWIETASVDSRRELAKSHPMRVRGLKQHQLPCNSRRPWSHPMRVRGLKHNLLFSWLIFKLVAPHAGAWIETSCQARLQCRSESHPMRVRGLKLVQELPDFVSRPVAPHAGAWIETR